jgi:DNA/RNA-binding domain of Phe-tRNA-synthetase-like protein
LLPLKKNSTEYLLNKIFCIGRGKEKICGIKIGVALISGLEVKKIDEELEKIKQQAIKERSNLTMGELDKLSSIMAYRRLFRDFVLIEKSPSIECLLEKWF